MLSVLSPYQEKRDSPYSTYDDNDDDDGLDCELAKQTH